MPQIPFQWNGRQHDPAEIRRFDGKAIAYLPTRSAAGDVHLRIVDDMEVVRNWLAFRHQERLMGSGSVRSMAHQPASVTVGEHVLQVVIGPEDPYPQLWVGRTLTLDPGWWYPDLTEVSLSWPWDNWNDQISFIGGSRSACTFWEHTHAQGSALLAGLFTGGDWLPVLTAIGWNDRISSFMNSG